MSRVFRRGDDLPVAVSASGAEIVDAEGRRYLDACGGAIVVNVGHCHPRVVDALASAVARLDYVHAATFTSDALEAYASAVAPFLPVDEPMVYPVSGGSEATETALKLARAYHLARGEPDRHVIVARRGDYHGNTRGALDASGRPTLRGPYEPWLGQTVLVEPVNPYRDPRTGAEHAAALADVFDQIGPERVAAFVAEPIGGATLGAVVPPPDYWPAVAAVCRRHGVLLVADEVMTGFGRTGRWFGVDHWDVRPDILLAGKGASSGVWPLGLCVASSTIHDTVRDAGGFVHGFTFSHHPLGAAVALAALRTLDDEGLVARVEPLGERLLTGLRERLGEHPHVGEVRGRGLLVAVEVVADRATAEPFAADRRTAERLTVSARERGVLVYPSVGCADGTRGDAILLGPPYVVSEDQLDRIVDVVAATIDADVP